MPEQPSKQHQAGYRWVYRLAGLAAVGGVIYSLSTNYDGTLDAVGNALWVGLGAALATTIVGSLIVLIFLTALDLSERANGPFTQGLTFALCLVALLFMFDFLFLRGAFLFFPTVDLFFPVPD